MHIRGKYQCIYSPSDCTIWSFRFHVLASLTGDHYRGCLGSPGNPPGTSQPKLCYSVCDGGNRSLGWTNFIKLQWIFSRSDMKTKKQSIFFFPPPVFSHSPSHIQFPIREEITLTESLLLKSKINWGSHKQVVFISFIYLCREVKQQHRQQSACAFFFFFKKQVEYLQRDSIYLPCSQNTFRKLCINDNLFTNMWFKDDS